MKMLCFLYQGLDAAVGDIGIFADRFQYVDFTESYMVSGLLMIVKEEKRNWKEIWVFMKTFTTTMWIILPLSHMFIISVVWFVRPESERLKSGFGDMLWFAISVVFNAHSKINNQKLFLSTFFLSKTTKNCCRGRGGRWFSPAGVSAMAVCNSCGNLKFHCKPYLHDDSVEICSLGCRY